jgi:hypothetical protein
MNQGPYLTDMVTIENQFEDYRLFQGLAVPTKISRTLSGHRALILRVTSVEINRGLTEGDFQN